jgi:hypothetical protein
MTDPTDAEPAVITVFEHNDAEGATLEVALVGPRKWLCLTVDEARDLADQLLDAADTAEECSRESEVPLRTR